MSFFAIARDLARPGKYATQSPHHSAENTMRWYFWSIFETLVLRPSRVSISLTSLLSIILPEIVHRIGPGRTDPIEETGVSATKSALSLLTEDFEPTLT